MLVSKKSKVFINKIILLFCLCVAIGITSTTASEPLKIGWASSDITPEKPVLLRGQFYARMSERVLDPIGATALSFESTATGKTNRTMIITCDLVVIPDYLRDQVRELVLAELPELEATDITVSATHTLTAPMMGNSDTRSFYGMSLEWLSGDEDAMTPAEYTRYETWMGDTSKAQKDASELIKGRLSEMLNGLLD